MTPPPDGPRVTRDEIAAGLHRGGLEAGDGVMVHSSLKSLGYVVGGAEAVIGAFMDVLTPAGDLMMPSFNHGRAFRGDGPGYLDPLAAPTSNGKIPATFWRMDGVLRSWNPTHMFAAWGANARRYTRFHHRTLTAGPESPLGLLAADGGWAVLVGVTCKVNTYHHVVEMTLRAPCLGRRTEEFPLKLPDGRTVKCRGWAWRNRGCPFNDGARYEQIMIDRGLITRTKIGASGVGRFRLTDCFEVVAGLLRGGGFGFPPCSGCPSRPKVGPDTVTSDWDEENDRLLPDSPAWGY